MSDCFVTVSEFDTYTGNFDEDEAKVSLKEMFLDSAQAIVIDYLGFDPSLEERTDVLKGSGNYLLQLSAKPITEITSITIDDVEQVLTNIRISKENLYSKDYIFTSSIHENVQVVYTAGFEDIPGAIKLCILRIATLLQTEANGNIGITSKSFDSSNRTFYQFTNFEKYLRSLDGYRVVKL